MPYATIDTNVTLSDDRVFKAELGTIESTFIGYEDHGIFTASLGFKFAGSGQAIPHIALDTYEESKKERVTTGFGLDYIRSLIDVVGTSSWENLKNQKVWVLREDSYGYIKGLLSTHDSQNYFIFDDLAKVYFG